MTREECFPHRAFRAAPSQDCSGTESPGSGPGLLACGRQDGYGTPGGVGRGPGSSEPVPAEPLRTWRLRKTLFGPDGTES
ncbi:MAG: hypothetical protein LBP22_11115 [Deltaproteobacteria bacterium]|nr:hypothetical protein [Deltaproteobacteria bacterium]